MSVYQAVQLVKNEPQLVAKKMVKGQQFYVKVDSYQKFKEGLVYTIKMAAESLNTTYEIANMLIEVVGLMKEQAFIVSAEDLVNNNFNNKKRLIDAVNQIITAYQTTFEKALRVEELEQALYSKEKEIDNLKREVEFYKNKYKEMTVHSTTIKGREEHELKENVLDIEKYYSRKSETEDELADLFK